MGIVNLFALMPFRGKGRGRSHLFLRSGGQDRHRNLPPDPESFLQLLTVVGGGKPMTVRAKVLRDRAIRGEEPLGLPRGLEPLHAPLALPGGLVRVLCTVVEIAMLAMLHSRQKLPL